jgi:hypothetical protein
MTKTKIVYETEDTEYEFVGNQISTHGTDILFRSHGDDKSVEIGELRFIHNEIYYCSESMASMEGTFYYWTPVDEIVSNTSVFCDLITDLEKGIMT